MKSRNRGQTLIEVVAAAAVVMVASVTLLAAVTGALANNRLAKERVIATRLAQEGVELMRQARLDAANWNEFYSAQEANAPPFYYCIKQELKLMSGFFADTNDIEPLATCVATINIGDTIYKRQVKIETDNGPPQKVKVNSEVIWESRGNKQTVASYGEMYEF